VPNLDDDQFEIYLKEFRPVAAAPFPLGARAKSTPRGGFLVSLVAAAAAAVILVFALLQQHRNGNIPPGATRPLQVTEQSFPSQPLTLGAANELLVNSPSLEGVLDSLESGSGAAAIPKGKQSALAVLSQEEAKP
jgi:hypothetical protein